MDGIQEVWVKLREHDPAPGLALTWTTRQGIRWANVTYELEGSVRTEWLPLLALSPRASDGAQSPVA